jgi:hypothetical protein
MKKMEEKKDQKKSETKSLEKRLRKSGESKASIKPKYSINELPKR